MATHHAACSCGQLTLIAEGDPIRISMCHCLSCQRRTGSVFGVQARFPRDKVRIQGNSTQYVRTADSSNRIAFHFCPNCGAIVHYHIEQDPEVVAVPVGAFADPSFASPTVSVYEARKHGWVAIPAEWDHHE